VLLFAFTIALFAQDDPGEFFEKRVRPVLSTRCFGCHGTAKQGGLRLDSRAAMLAGGASGAAISPGKPEESALIRAVTRTDPKVRMPLGAPALREHEIADLTSWIQAGAPWPEEAKAGGGFWSFQPLRRPPLPDVQDTKLARNAIDRFVLSAIERQGIRIANPADKRTLIRRATFDLTGLPPTPEEVRTFVADESPGAFAKVVDRLLASPRYGERWGRHWLDVARYADGDAPDNRPVYIGYGMAKDGYVNTFRYRDWVVDAFNSDMPYDRFVKAQIAADLLPASDRGKLLPGLGFFGLGPWFTGDDVVFVEARATERDDKIDALTKGFLGLTVSCARCHDHKYDPISQRDYYALAGIFASSGYAEIPLAPDPEVKRYRTQHAKVQAQEKALANYVAQTQVEVASRLAAQTAKYLMAFRKVVLSKPRPDPARVAEAEGLDSETFVRWGRYLSAPQKIEHPFLRPWLELLARGGGTDAEAKRTAEEFEKLVLDVIREKIAIRAANDRAAKSYLPDPDERRAVLPGDLMQFERFQYKQKLVEKVMQPHRFYVWLDVVQGEQASQDYEKKDGIYEYDFKRAVRFYTTDEKSKLNEMLAELKALEKAQPAEYAYAMGMAEASPADLKLNIRGNPHALGDPVSRGLPSILGGEQISKGSGRLELAEAIVRHPLSARVIANRVWMHHFGRGIVATPSNFGAGGDRPTHPELLDYLATRLIENGWSIKALHREIMLSATYQLSAAGDRAADPENRWFGRANVRRLDVEELRDSLLFVGGTLDERIGGPALELTGPENRRRTIYARVRRSVYVCNSGTGGVDRMLQLFDFPDPTTSVDHRTTTTVPLQGLFFLNSDLVMGAAERLSARIQSSAANQRDRISQAYEILFSRPPTEKEAEAGAAFLKEGKWEQYAQALLSSGAYYHVN
jgi:cytochrome c553